MSRHSKPHLRCRECRMHLSLCICALLPRIETRTRVVLIIHQLESLKPTNTGVVAARCLPNSAIVYRGRPPEAGGASMTGDAPTLSAAGAQRLMLFPHASATPLEDWRGRAEPIALLVPDGTWRQAGRTRTQLAAQLGDIPCVSLPAAPAQKRLRNSFDVSPPGDAGGGGARARDPRRAGRRARAASRLPDHDGANAVVERPRHRRRGHGRDPARRAIARSALHRALIVVQQAGRDPNVAFAVRKQ